MQVSSVGSKGPKTWTILSAFPGTAAGSWWVQSFRAAGISNQRSNVTCILCTTVWVPFVKIRNSAYMFIRVPHLGSRSWSKPSPETQNSVLWSQAGRGI